MSRGYTSITLKGGNRNGEIIDDVPLRNLPKTISFQSECYFAKSSNGNMSLMKGQLCTQWHSYSEDIYTKSSNQTHEQGTTYEFIEKRDIERCSAITKQNTQCLKPAIHNKNYCSETHKSKGN